MSLRDKGFGLFSKDELDPVDIGQWTSYSFALENEQLELQRANLIPLPIRNENGVIKFIYSKYIAQLSDYLHLIEKNIKTVDTTVVIEDEVYYSSKIEGCKTTRIRTSEIHNGAAIVEDDVYNERMIKNNFDAVKLLNLYGHELNDRKLYTIWCTLVDGCCDNQEVRGELYRSGPVYIGGHEGVQSSQIAVFMRMFFDFYNSSYLDSIPFVKSAILHYIFEDIHPFCDGNGRLGRLLINNYLISRGIDSCRAVSFSRCIDANRARYDLAFVESDNSENDITPFIVYMLNTMVSAYECIQKE